MYKKRIMICLALSCIFLWIAGAAQEHSMPPTSHPDVSSWQDLFDADLSNAIYPEGIWTFEDGSEIPSWLSKPLADLPTQGHIGFQGKHAGAPIYFRNIKIKELK